MEVKPLMVTDVKALGVLSADVRSELQFELCQPYLMRNGFYRVCQHVETAVLKSIMVDCITFTFYRAGEAAFEAGQDAKHAYFIERGTLEYQQNRRTSKVKRKLRVGAHNEIIIAEAALWTFWDHVGTLTAPNPASMLKMNVDKHTKIIAESELMGEFAAELALHFRTRLSMAKPPQAPWPNDIEVPCTSFDEMIVCASKIVRSLVSRIGLELVKDQVGQWASAVFRNHPKNIEELEKEVTKSKCMLMANTHGDVERLAAVSTINISRCDGTTLMQLGTWDPESGLRVSCKLPGTKQELGETAQEAMTRVLETDLLPFRGLVDLSQLPVHHEVEWSRSEKYNMRTKYLRTIFQLEVRNEMDLPQLQRLETDPSRDKGPPMVKRHSFRGFMGMSAGRTLTRRSGSQNKMDLDSLGCIADTHEIVGLPDGESQRVLICGWLHEEEVDRFRGEGEGKAVLERLMSRIHIDELVMSSVKDLTPTIVPISDGSEVVARDRTVSYDNRTDEKSMDTRSVDNRSEELYGILGALPKDAHALDD
ncbi:aarA [Symbiodinium natans]|uniref:AarA protein n=1 Tax=Symbiodinium natans TaxID=878477 RepID=A0A812I937_9DINO|nr:aarA [Symbiodinium natans]